MVDLFTQLKLVTYYTGFWNGYGVSFSNNLFIKTTPVMKMTQHTKTVLTEIYS